MPPPDLEAPSKRIMDEFERLSSQMVRDQSVIKHKAPYVIVYAFMKAPLG